MNYAAQYARALYDLETQNPHEGKTYLHNLREVLNRRGHLRLLPRIYAEYKKLLEQKSRQERYAKVTPEQKRTKTLLDLYQRLIS